MRFRSLKSLGYSSYFIRRVRMSAKSFYDLDLSKPWGTPQTHDPKVRSLQKYFTVPTCQRPGVPTGTSIGGRYYLKITMRFPSVRLLGYPPATSIEEKVFSENYHAFFTYQTPGIPLGYLNWSDGFSNITMRFRLTKHLGYPLRCFVARLSTDLRNTM